MKVSFSRVILAYASIALEIIMEPIKAITRAFSISGGRGFFLDSAPFSLMDGYFKPFALTLLFDL